MDCGYTDSGIVLRMKPIEFLGDSLRALRRFPDKARRDAGFELDAIQRGLPASDAKPMPTIGRGVEELRVWDDTGTYRVIYTARLGRCGLCAACVSEEDAGYGAAGDREGSGEVRALMEERL